MTKQTPPRNQDEPVDPRPEARKKALRMVALTTGILLAIVVVFVVVAPPQFMEMRLSVLLKLGAGVLATILLAAGLMAAAFYSDASGHDDETPGA